MYFNNQKEDTNIDNQFKRSNKGFNFKNKKMLFLIGGGILLISLITLIIILINNRTRYFIELYGDEFLTIYAGTNYNEQGYIGYDNKKNNMTSYITIDSNLDTSTIGEYQITYKLNTTKKVRTVKVVERPTGYTTIYLKGDLTIYLKVGEVYNEPGYSVIDTVDSDLTEKLTISGKVDTSNVGTYKLIYSVTNSSGVTTSEVRTVIVNK